jgi:NADPH:quinone reductase-like Zn-dependent oxidoreductase
MPPIRADAIDGIVSHRGRRYETGPNVAREKAMKAVILTKHGGPETLIYGEAPDPVAGPGQDAVFGVTDQRDEGAYAEKIAIKAAIIAKKPARLGHAEAAAMALTSLTALWAIEDTAKLKAGETILIQGGAGGVAGFGIQLSRHIGATIVTTASAPNHDYVRKLGANRVIDYTAQDFTKAVSGCDVVFDTVGGAVRAGCYAVLKPGGRLVFISPTPDGFTPPRADVETLRPAVTRDRAHLERMLALLAAGAVWPPNIVRYKLADAAEAHRVCESRHLQGKLVFEVR